MFTWKLVYLCILISVFSNVIPLIKIGILFIIISIAFSGVMSEKKGIGIILTS